MGQQDAFGKYTYILFDSDDLQEEKEPLYSITRSYSEIEDKQNIYPDQTIYNFIFHNTQFPDKRELSDYLYFKESVHELKQLPHEVLVSITPLVRNKQDVRNVTDNVINGNIELFPPDSLLQGSVRELFYATYAPLGIFDQIPDVSIKHTDYKLVLKKKDEYFLLNDTTLTELYVISNEANYYPTEYGCCTIHTFGQRFRKGTKVHDVGERFLTYPARLNGKIFMEDVETVALSNESVPYRLASYWTNGIRVPRTTSLSLQPKHTDIYLFDGIGDFQYLSTFGIINGNFRDFFNGPKNYFSVDKEINQKYELRFKVKFLNGIPFDQVLKELKQEQPDITTEV